MDSRPALDGSILDWLSNWLWNMYLTINRYLYVFVIKGKYAYYYTYLDIKINFPFICCCCFQGSPTTFGSGQKIRITDDCTSSFIFTGTLDTLLDKGKYTIHSRSISLYMLFSGFADHIWKRTKDSYYWWLYFLLYFYWDSWYPLGSLW